MRVEFLLPIALVAAGIAVLTAAFAIRSSACPWARRGALPRAIYLRYGNEWVRYSRAEGPAASAAGTNQGA